MQSPHTTEGRTAIANGRSPAIWRCKNCGALVHPSNEQEPAAWCTRCGRVTESRRDGGEG